MYDSAANRTRVDDSKGGVTTSTFDALNRLTGREVGGSSATKQKVTWSYTADGQYDTTTRYKWNGSSFASVGTTTYAYDAADRLTGMRHADGSNTTLATYAYGYDAANRLTSETLNGTPRTYGYDTTDQLTSDNGTSHGYDSTGNRTDTGYSTGSNNRLASDGTWDYSYDGEGNVVERQDSVTHDTWYYTYDLENRLVTAWHAVDPYSYPFVSLSYDFDPFGNRTGRVTYDGRASVLTDERFGYDGWDPATPIPAGNENFNAWIDLDGSNTLTVRRVFGAGFDVLVSRQDAGGTVEWYGTDHLGSVRQVFDNSTGAVANTVDFDAFGAITSGVPVDRYAYTGREWDSDLKLQYSRARMYDPAVGRWYAA